MIEVSPHGGGRQPSRKLPQADCERWRPLRSGLVNLYRYDNEEFWFEQGRLLLRGNNGTGKSRVLALQLPFLLDGEVAAHRLEPDGDPAKRIEWNLLMDRFTDRIGYTWLEFGRRNPGGALHYLTLGCGLHAAEGRGLVNKWFFVTTQRIGEDLSLIAPEGYPLGRERLAEKLGTLGEVFATAARYRAAVNDALFKLNEHQYLALVGLLVQLRQPQLQRKLDEKHLSAALGQALRPLSASVIGDVAEAFRTLESDQAALQVFIKARRGADAFLTEYRRYAQIATRRAADRVRTTHSAYETTLRRLREAKGALEKANIEQVQAAERLEQLTLNEASATAAVATLQGSPQMRTAGELRAAGQLADERTSESDRARGSAARTRDTLADQVNELTEANERAALGRTQLDEAHKKALSFAVAAGVERDHRTIVDALSHDDNDMNERISVARSRFQDVADRRLKASRHLRGLNDALTAARRSYDEARDAHASRSTQLDNAVDDHARMSADHTARSNDFTDGYHVWVASLSELHISSADALEGALNDWCATPDGASPLTGAVREAERHAAMHFASLRADAQGRLSVVDAELAELHEEMAQLKSGRHVPPPSPHTRNEDSRAGRLGAPLWRLCDFRSDVAPAARAGLEAALEASGLLDAWVMPDGRLLDPDEEDTVIIANDSVPPVRNALLFLAPAIDPENAAMAAVSPTNVESLLRAIGVGSGEGDVWIADDGRWRVGPLIGRWKKEAAQHIGETARDAARRQRLMELSTEISTAQLVLSAIGAELQEISRREGVVHVEVASVPDESRVKDAAAAAAASKRQVDRWRHEVAAAEEQVIIRQRSVAGRLEERDRAALDLALSAWVDDLRALDDATNEYRAGVGELLNASERHARLAHEVGSASRRVAAATAEHQRAAAMLAEAERASAEATSAHDTLRASSGATVDAILARLVLAEEALRRVKSELDQSRRSHGDLRVRVAEIEGEIGAQEGVLERDTADRQTAISGLEGFGRSGLLTLSDPSFSNLEPEGWSATRAVDVARRLDSTLGSVAGDDAAWDRSQHQIHSHLQALMEILQPYDYDPAADLHDGIVVVTASFQGRRCSVAELRAGLNDEILNRQALLDAREREILENHLVGEVAQHLHDLLREGDQWVENMNRELRDRPTSTGMTLRFRWEPSDTGPEEFPLIRRNLLQAGAAWTSAERTAVGAFLQRRIQVEREANEAGSWQEYLNLAFDYREWHQFSVERQQDGKWKRLTKRTHGTGSGGEKAIALTIPQFAAAAAHYRSADPLAPRLILLDEAFVGIDTDMRSKCMGLLENFKLDFVMTSEREWGCYATLPGVAIYQLATRPGIEAIGLTRWVWNGHQRVRSDPPAAARIERVDSTSTNNRTPDSEQLEWPT